MPEQPRPQDTSVNDEIARTYKYLQSIWPVSNSQDSIIRNEDPRPRPTTCSQYSCPLWNNQPESKPIPEPCTDTCIAPTELAYELTGVHFNVTKSDPITTFIFIDIVASTALVNFDENGCNDFEGVDLKAGLEDICRAAWYAAWQAVHPDA